MVSSELREKLDEVTVSVALVDQPHIVEGLKKHFHHDIRLLELAPDDVENQYVCFMHALGLKDSTVVRNAMRRNLKVKFGTDFVQHLIRSGNLVEDTEGPIIIYFSGGVAKHAGLKNGDVFISKWGIGHLWGHKLHEVPATYGNEYKFFSIQIAPGAIEEEFTNWVKAFRDS